MSDFKETKELAVGLRILAVKAYQAKKENPTASPQSLVKALFEKVMSDPVAIIAIESAAGNIGDVVLEFKTANATQRLQLLAFAFAEGLKALDEIQP
jgi:hypothetical protein